MKAILIAFLLLASVVFLPTSILARTLNAVTPGSGDPSKPAIKCDPGKPYRSCLPNKPAPAPRKPCSPYSRSCRPPSNN